MQSKKHVFGWVVYYYDVFSTMLDTQAPLSQEDVLKEHNFISNPIFQYTIMMFELEEFIVVVFSG